MGATNGVMMIRILGVLAAAALVANTGGDARGATWSGDASVVELGAYAMNAGDMSDAAPSARTPIDISALLVQAHGAPPMICALAARSLRSYGWGNDRADAPATPLKAIDIGGGDDSRSAALPAADITRLMDALSSDD